MKRIDYVFNRIDENFFGGILMAVQCNQTIGILDVMKATNVRTKATMQS